MFYADADHEMSLGLRYDTIERV